jgi:hypothetical protein
VIVGGAYVVTVIEELTVVNVIVMRGGVNVVTVSLVIAVSYCTKCDRDDTWACCSYCDSGKR